MSKKLTKEQGEERDILVEQNREKYDNDRPWKNQLTSDFIGEDVYTLVKELWGDLMAELIVGNISDEEALGLLGSSYNPKSSDDRSPVEHASNMLRSKVESIYIQNYFHTVKKIKLIDDGCEKDHVFIQKWNRENKVTHDPDFKIERKDQEKISNEYVELVSNKGGTWQSLAKDEKGKKIEGMAALDLRGSKLPYLQRMVNRGERVYVLAVDIKNNQFALIKLKTSKEMKKEKSCKYMKSVKAFGGKEAWRIYFKEELFQKFEEINVKPDLSKLREINKESNLNASKKTPEFKSSGIISDLSGRYQPTPILEF